MKGRRLWLTVTAVLFISWLGYLGYLAATAGRPILPGRAAPVVLRRPQFLISTVDVIADVGADGSRASRRATVVEVHWPPSAAGDLQGKTITVSNLSDCSGWTGPGRYILPLVHADSAYRVAPIPPSPGYEPGLHEEAPIYPLTDQTRAQLERVPKAVGAASEKG
jgi:hypothetical protein